MIKTQRLSLVPLSKENSKDLIKLWGDYDVIKYTYNTLMTTQEDCLEKLINWLILHRDNLGPNKFAILLNDNLIGIAGFPVIDNDNFKCGFFYQIIREYWDNGYGFEAANALLNYIFEKHPNAVVIADVVVNNPASIKILTKLGFSKNCIEEKGFKNNGMELDIVHFDLNNYIQENVIVKELNLNDINKTLLENFNRYQKIQRCWRKENDKWVLKDNPYIENWDNEKKQQIINELYKCKQQGGIVFGVFYDNKLIGFSSIEATLFGEYKEYIELTMLQISHNYRNKGIGKKLFFLSADKAKEKGAKKLYISANSSEESQAFYRSVGCIKAKEINTKIAENEPFDCQMEYS